MASTHTGSYGHGHWDDDDGPAPPSYEVAVATSHPSSHPPPARDTKSPAVLAPTLSAPDHLQSYASSSRSPSRPAYDTNVLQDPRAAAAAAAAHAPQPFLPVVVPQLMKGNNSSPFTRAYAPSLAAHGVTRAQFVAFIDALNESWLATPPLQATSLAGSVMGLVPLGTVQLAGHAVTAASRLGAAAVSFARAKAYLAGSNARFWHPRRLHARMLRTERMCAAARLPGGAPALERDAFTAAGADAQARRIAALGGHVAPIDFDVPPQEAPENWFKQVGAWAAERTAGKQTRKMEKRREKAVRKVEREQRKEERRGRDSHKSEREIDKYVRKESKGMRKIYWIVITPVEEQALEDQGDVSSEEDYEEDYEERDAYPADKKHH